MYDRFVQCPGCQNVTTVSHMIDGECPECHEKSMTYGFVYLDEKNELFCSLKELSIPTSISMKEMKRCL